MMEETATKAAIAPAITADKYITGITTKLLTINAIVAVAGAIILMIVAGPSWELLSGFAAGIVVGLTNQKLSMRSVRRSFQMDPENVKNFVMVRYYMRFALMVLLMAVLIGWTRVSPWGILIGFSLTLITTIGAIYTVARKKEFA